MGFFRSILSLIIKKGKISKKDYIFKQEEYEGLDNIQTPMHIYYCKKSTKKTIIIFLGASPDGENHKSVIFLAKIITQFGYNVFVPRIPPLMKLDISNKNVNWIVYLYDLISRRNDVDSQSISTLGLSYGGGMLLKACLDQKIKEKPPKSVFLYGAGCNATTILNFITNGKYEYNNQINQIKPHDWGLTVFFHYFMDYINFGFNKDNIKEVIQLRIDNHKLRAEQKLRELNNIEYNIANAIISGTINKEVQDIVNDTIKNQQDSIEDLSCRSICQYVKNKVFILHGANDNMIPFTESIQLNTLIPKSELLISFLFEHKGVASKRSIFFKFKESIKLVQFLYKFHKFNEN